MRGEVRRVPAAVVESIPRCLNTVMDRVCVIPLMGTPLSAHRPSDLLDIIVRHCLYGTVCTALTFRRLGVQ